MLTVMSGSHAITAPLALADNLDASVAIGRQHLTLSGGISENSPGLSLTEDGGGLLILSGTNKYSGGTTVDGGTLIVASSTALADGSELDRRRQAPLRSSPRRRSPPRHPRLPALQINPVPEPGTLALLAVAVAGFLFNCRTRRRNHE